MRSAPIKPRWRKCSSSPDWLRRRAASCASCHMGSRSGRSWRGPSRWSRVINFALGAFVLVGAYVISYLAAYEGVPFGIAVALAAALVAAGGAGFQAAVVRRTRTDDVFTIVMITIGLSILLTAGIAATF